MTNDAERVSDIVAVEAVERIWDFLAPLRQREKGMEISAVFIGRMKELEASDQSARDLLNEQDDIIEAQSKALAEAIPYVETLHSLLAGKPQRQQVMAVIRRMQAATPTPENPNG